MSNRVSNDVSNEISNQVSKANRLMEYLHQQLKVTLTMHLNHTSWINHLLWEMLGIGAYSELPWLK